MATPKKKQRRSSAVVAEERVRTLKARLEVVQYQAALSYYTSADKGRRNRDWKAPPVSADQAIIPDKQTLVARARTTVANSWIGKAAVRAHKRNVVGRGIMVVPVAKDANGDELTELNRDIGQKFTRWAGARAICDLEQRRTFWQQQRLIASEEFVAGEAMVVWNYDPMPGNIGLRFQFFETEQFDLSIQSYSDPTTGEIREVRGGVEIDENGAAVAYHFYRRNPNDYLNRQGLVTVRIPAMRVFHYFDAERVLQTGGVTHFAPVLQDGRDFGAINTAMLMRMRMEACIGMIIKKTMPSTGPMTLPLAPGDSGTTASGARTTDFMPGMVPELRPGEDITPFIPSTPGNQYSPFTELILRGFGAGLGMSFGALTRHNDANYSAARQDMLEDEREIGPQQDALIDHFVLPSYELWFRLAAMSGQIDVPADEFAAEPERFLEAEYVTPARPWIDPEKEANAYEKALNLRIITRKEIVAMRGAQFQSVIRQIAEERDEAAEVDITFPEDVSQQVAQQPAQPDPNAPDDNADPNTKDSNSADMTVSVPRGVRVKLQLADAPNYRSAGDDVQKCATCSNVVGSACKMFDFTVDPNSVCDDWTAEPIDNTSGGRAFPPGPNGDRPIDDPRSTFNDRAARGVQ